METPGRSAALTAAPASRQPTAGWLASPGFDALFLANVGWLVALVPGFAAGDGATPVSFWQIYFLTVPHRWLTLFLVAVDPDRRGGQAWPFVGLASLALLLVGGVWLAGGGFVCLLLVDYVWNGWHFASQHAGVLRMYARKAGVVGRPALEKHGLRLFLGYVIARTAGWSTGWLEEVSGGPAWLVWLDRLLLLIPAGLLALAARDPGPWLSGKRLYLASVCGLYAALLTALSLGPTPLVLALTVAAAWFHASEYLALVTLYAWQRQSVGTGGLFRRLAGHWLTLLAGFVLCWGIVAVLGEWYGGEFWFGLNLWAALLHYTYDGMIWKLRRPATAAALGLAAAGAR